MNYLLSKYWFRQYGFQTYFIFHPLFNTFRLRNPDHVVFNSWIRVDISTEEIRPLNPSVSAKTINTNNNSKYIFIYYMVYKLKLNPYFFVCYS